MNSGVFWGHFDTHIYPFIYRKVAPGQSWTNRKQPADHHVTGHFRKKSIIFRDMRTQGERNAEVRLSISCPSAEETESQIYLLKKTDLSFRNVHVLERPKRN